MHNEPQPANENYRNLRRLVLSAQATPHKTNLLVAICDDLKYRDELIRTYETELTAKGVSCHRVQLDQQQFSLKQALLNWQYENPNLCNPEATNLVTACTNDDLIDVSKKFTFSLQWTRESFRAHKFPIVLWLTQALAQEVREQAPDFWSWRGGLFEFVEPQ